MGEWASSKVSVSTATHYAGTSNGQTAVGTGATAIGQNGKGRTSLTIYNPAANKAAVFVGLSNQVTTAKGYQLDPGYGLTITANQQVYAIAAATGTTVSWIDQ